MLRGSKQRSHNPAAKGSATPEKQPSSQVLADQSGVARKKQKDKEDGSEKKGTAKNSSEKKTVSTVDCKDKYKHKSETSDKGGKTGPEKHAAKGEIGKQNNDGKGRVSEKNRAVKDGVSGKERGAEKVGSEVKNTKKSSGKTADVLLAKDEGAEKVVAKPKKEKEKIEYHIQNELRNPELEKELEKRAKRRGDVSYDKDKRHEEIRKDDDRRYRESNDKRLSSSDDRKRSGYFQDEKHRDGRYSRDKLSDDLDMDRRHHDDRCYNERSSSKRTNEYIKEDRFTESHKKTKLFGRDNDGDPYEDLTNSRDQRDRKRLYDECEDHRDLRPQEKKQPYVDIDVDSHIMEDKFTGRHLKESKLQGSDNYDDQFIDDHKKNSRNNRSMKRSPDGKDYHRDVRFRDRKQPRGDVETKALDTARSRSNQGDSTQRSERLSQEKCFSSSTSRGDSSGFCQRELKDQTTGSVRKTAANRKYDKTTGSDSPVKCDTDLVRSRPKEGRGGNIISTGSSFSSRGGHSSPCGRPPRPVKHQINNRADMSSFELDNTFQSGDYSTGLSQGNAWRTNSPWLPNANFLAPFQHHRPPPFHSAPGQFPIPFGLNQPMNMNPTGVYPFVYGPVDVASHFHHWAGYNNLVPGNPHNYLLFNQNLMGNGEWERNPSMWNGQRNNVNMDPKPQETEYTPMPLVHDELDGKLNHESQSYQPQPEVVSVEKIEAKHSDIPSGKHADETLPKNMSEKRTQPKICHVKSYLSKLDISPDLASPELYNRCLTLLETRDADAETKSKQIKEATKATSKTSNHLSSLFPETKDAIFERTVSLFRKQNETRRLKLPVPHIFVKEDSNPPEASNLVLEGMLEASNAEILKELTDQASEKMSEASRAKIMKRLGDQASGEMRKASNVEIVKPLADLDLRKMSEENANATTDSEEDSNRPKAPNLASREMLEASNAEIVKALTDQASDKMSEASKAKIMEPLGDQASGEMSKAFNAEIVKQLVDLGMGEMSGENANAATDSEDELYTNLDSSNVYIVKPTTDQASREISGASNADVVKPLIDQTLGETSEANVSAATGSEDELYTGLDVFPGEAMELQSNVTSGVTVIVENHSPVHETLNCSLPGTMSSHKKQFEANSVKFPVTSILPKEDKPP